MAVTIPTIVLVHGAWHAPPAYETFIDALRTQGFTVHCPTLPTCNGVLPPINSLPEDVAHIRGMLLPLVQAGKHVILIMHSYGGAVGSDAAQGLSLIERTAEGEKGGVIHLLYLCAYILPPGGSVWSIVGQTGRQDLWPKAVKDYPDGSTFPQDPYMLLFNSADEKQFAEHIRPYLVRHPMAAFKARTTSMAWRGGAPITYVRTLQDHAVPSSFQDIMLAKVKAEGVDIRIEVLDTNHSVFFTKQKEVVDLAVSLAKESLSEE